MTMKKSISSTYTSGKGNSQGKIDAVAEKSPQQQLKVTRQ
jgi:hypothetical protein